MTSTCARCGEALARTGGFCGKCGAPQPEPAEDPEAVARHRAVMERFAADGSLDAVERLQLETLRHRLGISPDTHQRLLAEVDARAPKVAGSLRLYVDVATIRHFEVAARCLLRLRVENLGELALERVELHCQVAGEPAPPPASTGGTLLPRASEVVPLWLIPRVAGHQELRGVVAAVDVLGARTCYRVSKIQFRVASAAEAARAHVVNIDQRSARVVDNSRSSFGAESRRDGAALISDGDGEWSPVVIEVISAEEASRLAPALAVASAHTQGEGKYAARSLIGRSPQFALHECALPDGRPGMVKVAASAIENPALDREAYVLRMMAEEAVRRDRADPDGAPFNYQYFFPELVDTFLEGEARTNVLAFPAEIERLGQLRPLAALSEGGRVRVDPKSAAWILGKTLKVLAFAHDLGIANGRVEAANVLCETDRHGVLLFDWTQARILDDGAVPAEIARREVSQAARLTAELLGADGATGALPSSDQLADGRFEELLRRLVAGEPSDAGAAHRELYQLLGAIWPRGFHPFTTIRREG